MRSEGHPMHLLLTIPRKLLKMAEISCRYSNKSFPWGFLFWSVLCFPFSVVLVACFWIVLHQNDNVWGELLPQSCHHHFSMCLSLCEQIVLWWWGGNTDWTQLSSCARACRVNLLPHTRLPGGAAYWSRWTLGTESQANSINWVSEELPAVLSYSDKGLKSGLICICMFSKENVASWGLGVWFCDILPTLFSVRMLSWLSPTTTYVLKILNNAPKASVYYDFLKIENVLFLYYAQSSERLISAVWARNKPGKMHHRLS